MEPSVDPCRGCKKPSTGCNETCEHFDPCVHACELSWCPYGCPHCKCDRPECVAARQKLADGQEKLLTDFDNGEGLCLR